MRLKGKEIFGRKISLIVVLTSHSCFFAGHNSDEDYEVPTSRC